MALHCLIKYVLVIFIKKKLPSLTRISVICKIGMKTSLIINKRQTLDKGYVSKVESQQEKFGCLSTPFPSQIYAPVRLQFPSFNTAQSWM